MKKLIAILLLAATLMLSSCEYFSFLTGGEGAEQSGNQNSDDKIGNHTGNRDFYPDGYTGGLWLHSIYEGPVVEYRWVETYEELRSGIDLMKSHGSTFDNGVLDAIAAIECDDLPFDVKYVFVISGEEQCRKYGDEGDFFDRKLEQVNVFTYIFFDEVTINELEFSHVGNYDCYRLSAVEDDVKYRDIDFSTETTRYEYYNDNTGRDDSDPYYEATYDIYYEDTRVAELRSVSFNATSQTAILEENINTIINSFIIFNLD